MNWKAALAWLYCTGVLAANVFVLIRHLRQLYLNCLNERDHSGDYAGKSSDDTGYKGLCRDVLRSVVYGLNVGAFVVVFFLFLSKL